MKYNFFYVVFCISLCSTCITAQCPNTLFQVNGNNCEATLCIPLSFFTSFCQSFGGTVTQNQVKNHTFLSFLAFFFLSHICRVHYLMGIGPNPKKIHQNSEKRKIGRGGGSQWGQINTRGHFKE